MTHERIVVLDFGGQYNQLIARAVREAGVYAEILPYDSSLERIQSGEDKLMGIILTGGPDSVYLPDSLSCDPRIFSAGVPVLGICYGMQLLAHTLGGRIGPAKVPEFGHTEITFEPHPLFDGLDAENLGAAPHVWMNHNDSVQSLPEGFSVIARTPHCPIAAYADDRRRLYGLQFHAEVRHTPGGRPVRHLSGADSPPGRGKPGDLRSVRRRGFLRSRGFGP